MPIPFEPSKSFCYRFARYELLELIAREPEALSGLPFRLIDVAKRVTEKILTAEQLASPIRAAIADREDTIFGSIKFFATLHAKRLPSSPFRWLGDGGMYQLKKETDFEQEMEEAELEADEDDIIEDFIPNLDGWIYAFSFPVLVKSGQAFPIKIGKTTKDVEGRVAQQCKGSASFDNPVILGKWQVNRVNSFEQAIHFALETRGKWRENVPGTEWFNTTLEEVEAIINFIKQ
jgi:hypothetical protein